MTMIIVCVHIVHQLTGVQIGDELATRLLIQSSANRLHPPGFFKCASLEPKQSSK